MNFHDLKIIVNKIKREITCPNCQNKYVDESIEIIGAINDEQFFFQAFCADCKLLSFITMHIDADAPITDLPKLGTAPRMGKITQDEVLDMHNFLKDFDGDISSILPSSQKKS
ncbi:MAG: hypothetical protein WC897_05645 [Candidatus Gracilibacteria bacterium]